ncbi:MAG: hypothetical protein IKV41_03180 [Oscillospiraceae bacterium]|nr:hypothetical protein [Oscillospiraceae bacterium]
MFANNNHTAYQVKFLGKKGEVLKTQTVIGKDDATALALGKMIVLNEPTYYACTVYLGNLLTGRSFMKETA